MTSVSIEIERSAAEVFTYATDPSRFHEWQRRVVSGSTESKDGPAVGDHCLTTRRIGRAERPATSELVLLDPPHAWAVRGINGPIRAQVDVSVVPVADQRLSSRRLLCSSAADNHAFG